MALGSTQPLTDMSTRITSWGQRRPVGKADNLPPSCAVVTKSGTLNFLEPSGHLGPVMGLLYLLLCSDKLGGPPMGTWAYFRSGRMHEKGS